MLRSLLCAEEGLGGCGGSPPGECKGGSGSRTSVGWESDDEEAVREAASDAGASPGSEATGETAPKETSNVEDARGEGGGVAGEATEAVVEVGREKAVKPGEDEDAQARSERR